MSESGRSDFYVHSADVVTAWPEPGQAVLLHLETGMYHRVDGSAALVWKELESPITVEGLASRLCEAFPISREVALEDVRRFCTELLERKLVRVDGVG